MRYLGSAGYNLEGPKKYPPPTASPLPLQDRARGHLCLGGTFASYETVRFPPSRYEERVERRREGGAGVGWTELGGGPNWGDRPYESTRLNVFSVRVLSVLR